MRVGAIGYVRDCYGISNITKKNNTSDDISADSKMKADVMQDISGIIQKYVDENKITAEELKENKDWREMSDKEWSKMLEGIDEYLDNLKERLEQLKKMQDEAAQKAAMEADPGMRTIAASSAALNVVANGFESGFTLEDNRDNEKNWTKNLQTDDQTILRTAQAAQAMENTAISKLQEVQLTDNTIVGLSRTENITECASVEEDENNEKIWTITIFGEDGIISQKCQNGEIIERWEIKYAKSDDAKRVWKYLSKFDNDDDLKFAGLKDFWEDFLL